MNAIKTLYLLACLLLAVACSRHQARAALIEPLVETGASKLGAGGRHVGVNVPTIFHLDLDTRGPNHEGVRLSQSVLSGLVKVHVDRKRRADGSHEGPVRVKVAGVTVYDNNEPDLS